MFSVMGFCNECQCGHFDFVALLASFFSVKGTKVAGKTHLRT